MAIALTCTSEPQPFLVQIFSETIDSNLYLWLNSILTLPMFRIDDCKIDGFKQSRLFSMPMPFWNQGVRFVGKVFILNS